MPLLITQSQKYDIYPSGRHFSTGSTFLCDLNETDEVSLVYKFRNPSIIIGKFERMLHLNKL
jgi:hypothetical protein